LVITNRALIARKDRKVVARETLPKLDLMPTLTKRRPHHVLGPVETRLVVVVERKEEVLGARVRIRRQSAVTEEAHLLERLRRRQVNDVQRDAAGHLRQTEGAVRGLALGLGWPGERVPFRLGVLRGERALHENIDDAAVLGVHADEPAVLGRLRKRFEARAVVAL